MKQEVFEQFYNKVVSKLEEHEFHYIIHHKSYDSDLLDKDIKRFGYVVTNDFDEVRIKAPNTWGQSVYLLLLWDSDEDYSYGFTSVSRLADTFERQEAIKLMKDLGINWELEEV